MQLDLTLDYAFNLECSIKLGTSPGCTSNSMGRRSTDEDAKEITIQYEIGTKSAQMEQFGNIVTMKSTAFRHNLSKLLILISLKYM